MNAFISGSTSGIGLGIASALKEDGCKIAVNGRDCDRVQSIAKAYEALPIVADVSSLSGCQMAAKEIAAQWNHLDVLVCNVGSGRSVPPGEETSEEWQRMLRLNLFSATDLIRACENLFPATGGSIVCISSICGIEALNAPLAYSVAKAALNSYVACSARVLAKRNIRINAVAPGNIFFEGGTWDIKQREAPEAVQTMLDRDVPMRRFGTVEEVASAVTFLSSSKASFITGTVLVVDGGQCRS